MSKNKSTTELNAYTGLVNAKISRHEPFTNRPREATVKTTADQRVWKEDQALFKTITERMAEVIKYPLVKKQIESSVCKKQNFKKQKKSLKKQID